VIAPGHVKHAKFSMLVDVWLVMEMMITPMLIRNGSKYFFKNEKRKRKMAKTVLLTGIGGFIGGHCLEWWLENTDWDIIGVDSFCHKGTWKRIDEVRNRVFKKLKTGKATMEFDDRVEIYLHDLSTPIDNVLLNQLLDRRFEDFGIIRERKIDYIVNMASDSAVERSTTNPIHCLKNNFLLAVYMLEFARVAKPDVFIQISTDEVYGEAPPEPSPGHAEWSPIVPSNPYCLMPKTKIITKDGLVNIEDFNPLEHSVLSRKNTSSISKSYASQKFTYDYNGIIRNIKTRSDCLSCTPQHKVFVKRTFFSEGNTLESRNGGLLLRRPHKKVIEIPAEQLSVGDYIMTARYIPYPSDSNRIENSLAKFLGYFLGDGSYSDKTKYVRLADEKREYLEYYRALMKEYFGISKHSSTGEFGTLYDHSIKDCGYLQFASQKLRNTIDLSDKKNIINAIVRADKESVLSFLAGFFDAEAYYAYDNGLLRQIEVYQASRETLEIIQLLLRRNGIIGRIRQSEEGWKIIISDGLSVRIAFDLIDCKKKEIETTFSNYQHKKWNKFYYWTRIESIVDEVYSGKVYDLECPETHNYLANYFVVHNSASKAAQEAVAISYWRTFDVPVVITNCMNVIGEWQDPEKMLPSCIRNVLNGTEMPIYADKDDSEPSGWKIGSRVYTDAKCKADALMYILQNLPPARYSDGARLPDRYNVVGDVEFTNFEVAAKVAQILDKDLKYRMMRSESVRPGYDRRYALDGKKLRDLGWMPPFDSNEMFERIVKWTAENNHWVL